MAERRITIDDIAHMAGVGMATVSRVLNNNPHVAEPTRRRVLEVVESCNFRPSAAASRLSRGSSGSPTVGLLLPDIGNHFFFEIFETIYREFRREGVDLVIFNHERHDGEAMGRILGADISALLVFNFQLDDTERAILRSRNVSYFYVDHHSPDEPCIYTDNVAGGRLAAGYLLAKGCRDPCYVMIDSPARSNHDRLAGYSAELVRAGLPEPAVYMAGLDEESGAEVAARIVAERRHDGIFCFCDDMATGALGAVREAKANVRVVGFDGIRIARHIGLSTISQNPPGMGRAAARLAVRMIGGGAPLRIARKLKPELLDRGS